LAGAVLQLGVHVGQARAAGHVLRGCLHADSGWLGTRAWRMQNCREKKVITQSVRGAALYCPCLTQALSMSSKQMSFQRTMLRFSFLRFSWWYWVLNLGPCEPLGLLEKTPLQNAS
jgi:hypothetical protein